MEAIESLKKGAFFKRKADSKKVYVKQDYNRFAKRYAANDFEDISSFLHLKKGTLVHTDFEF